MRKTGPTLTDAVTIIGLQPLNLANCNVWMPTWLEAPQMRIGHPQSSSHGRGKGGFSLL